MPVCRYVAEAGDRFLGWFALEGHADASMITRLCESLGLCPAHTRGLLGQPGAGGRMTAVYRYLLQAALGYLTEGTSPNAACPGCARDAESAERALDTLLTGLRTEDLRERYREAGGLCLPHLRVATASGGRRLAAWLAAQMGSRLAAGPPGLAVIAGERDADADVRARLRAVLPASPVVRPESTPPPDAPGFGDVCPVCLTAAQAERDVLGRAASPAARGSGQDLRCADLCPAHLHEVCSDLVGAADPAGEVAALLAERAQRWLAELTSPAGPAGHARPAPIDVAGGLAAKAAFRAQHVRPGTTQRTRWPGGCRGSCEPRPPSARARARAHLCLRHVMSLRQQDPRHADAAVRLAARSAQSLIRELEEAFRKRTWTHGHEARGREMTAWRRAAVLIDGRVYGGGPPGPL